MRRSLGLIATAAPLFVSIAAHAAIAPHPFKVVIDPGHGGADHGAIYRNGTYPISEKNVTLMIARQVATSLRAQGVDVTLTRRDDRDLALGKRTELANRMNADVFLSIHMNSAPGHELLKAEGVETYILNNATDASSRRLAHLENTVISHDGLDTPQAEDVALILRDMRLDANVSESKRLACAVQNGLAGSRAQKNRGVKQALFHVLLGADMPSILVEAGFLSSPRDRAAVLTSEGRQAMADRISRAIESYRALKGTRAASMALSRCRVR